MYACKAGISCMPGWVACKEHLKYNGNRSKGDLIVFCRLNPKLGLHGADEWSEFPGGRRQARYLKEYIFTVIRMVQSNLGLESVALSMIIFLIGRLADLKDLWLARSNATHR